MQATEFEEAVDCDGQEAVKFNSAGLPHLNESSTVIPSVKLGTEADLYIVNTEARLFVKCVTNP